MTKVIDILKQQQDLRDYADRMALAAELELNLPGWEIIFSSTANQVWAIHPDHKWIRAMLVINYYDCKKLLRIHMFTSTHATYRVIDDMPGTIRRNFRDWATGIKHLAVHANWDAGTLRGDTGLPRCTLCPALTDEQVRDLEP